MMKHIIMIIKGEKPGEQLEHEKSGCGPDAYDEFIDTIQDHERRNKGKPQFDEQGSMLKRILEKLFGS